jgi:hypothetical protein
MMYRTIYSNPHCSVLDHRSVHLCIHLSKSFDECVEIVGEILDAASVKILSFTIFLPPCISSSCLVVLLTFTSCTSIAVSRRPFEVRSAVLVSTDYV